MNKTQVAELCTVQSPLVFQKEGIGMDIVLEDEIKGGYLWRVKHVRGEEESFHSFPSVLLDFFTTSMY